MKTVPISLSNQTFKRSIHNGDPQFYKPMTYVLLPSNLSNSGIYSIKILTLRNMTSNSYQPRMQLGYRNVADEEKTKFTTWQIYKSPVYILECRLQVFLIVDTS